MPPQASTLAQLSSDPAQCVPFLLKVLASASSGTDVTSILPELIQLLSRPSGGTGQVRKLAYELCRHCTLAESDVQRLWECVRADANSTDAEVVASALRFMSALPATELTDRLVIGQLAQLLTPCLHAEAAVVRAAAVQALTAVLMLPEVQAAAASSSGLANSYEGLWDALSDSLLDERPFVVGLAAAATAQLLAWGTSGDASGFSGAGEAAAASSASSASPAAFMMAHVADRAAQRVAAALGPILETCGLVPAPGQVAVCDMLLALVQRMLASELRVAAGGPAPPPPPPGVPVPTLPSLASSVAAYMSGLLFAGDAAARTEAAGAVLALAADLAAAGPVAAVAAAGLPQALVLEAVQALFLLREREFVEAGLGDMCEAIAAALPALLPGARAQVLRSLWPLATHVGDVARRARIFSSAWAAAVGAEMDCRTSGAAPVITLGSTAPAAAAAMSAKAASVTSADDPLGLLAVLAAPSTTEAAAAGGPGANAAAAAEAGIVTAVPPAVSVTGLLGTPYMEALMAGRPPAAEVVAGSFTAAQAAASAATAASSSPSILTTVTSMARAAPPPPPGPSKAERTESGRIAAASGTAPADPVSGGKPGKPEKEKKGVFGGLFGGKSKDKSGKVGAETSAAAERAAEREAAAAAAAAAERQEAAAAAAAAAQRAAAAAASPAATPAAGGSLPDVKSGPSLEAAAVMSTRTIPHATLRHELLQCLLQQLANHPAAGTAAELAAEYAAAARHDRHPPTHATAGGLDGAAAGGGGAANATPPRRLTVVCQWAAMCSDVLAGSAVCVAWEPYVNPAITSQPSALATGRAPIDFNSLTVDLWLGLLQAAVQASRTAQAMLGRLVAEAAEAAAAAEAAGTNNTAFNYTGLGYGTPYGMTPGTGPSTSKLAPSITMESYCRALLSYLDEKANVMQGLIVKMLHAWGALAACVRPRVAWVASHCLALPGHWDDRWEALLGCLDALLGPRGTDVLGAARRADVMGSALAGSLYKAGRQAWADPSKPFLFDIPSASALCEAPEYEAAGLLAALSGMQHLTARLTNAIAEAVPHGAAGAAHGQAAAVAKRMEAVLRSFIGSEVAGLPHVRDWVRRILRSLATVLSYQPPVNLPVTVAALGFVAKRAHEADGTAPAADDDDDSSDASSAYHPDGEDTPSALPPALAAAAAAMAAAAAGNAQTPQAVEGGQDANAAAEGADGAAGGRPRGNSTTGTSYLVHSAVAAVPMWGYPFAPLCSVALQNSKRARRQRALLSHLASATAAAAAPRPVVASALAPLQPPEEGPAANPVLGGARLGYRLDQEAFWAALPSTHSPWQELTGPADPLLLRGCYARTPARGAGDAATVTVLLSAVNRLGVELVDVSLGLKTSGSLMPAAKRAASWELPRLAPHDRASASFKFKLLGYGELQLHLRLQLCPGPARTDATPLQLNCCPLDLPVAVLLRPPAQLPQAAEFFRIWNTLSARTELSGVCVWPGAEGGALLLSALLRQPLGCSWLEHTPSLGGYAAGFLAQTVAGDTLALALTTQLVPPPAPGGSAESFFSLSFRSDSPDLVLNLQAAAATWVQQLSSGTAALGSGGRPAAPAPSTRPPLHPRVAAMQQAYAASAAQVASVSGAPSLNTFASYGLPQGGAVAGTKDVSAAWLKSAALAEWQRLQSLAV
ncbi:hypothetical protein HYH03_015449 [Edaphochlamys debaryana]|uniref:Uncharacterized protein n=1 Tax=Edaphochlamys debaryana TaxID=47281 RepID=A0A835XL60_9CHLO|nr:hypothetical protein HYH03_015449 [Edaphochlamys debaryana]|eukprot:KAG2485866.1 hypothetical protein HYH03_015449 [Edaphochlamys debaryana]